MASSEIKVIKENIKFRIILMYAIFVFISAFIFNSPAELIIGMKEIILSPSLLLTDYIEVANLGSAFFNSGLLMILMLVIMKLSNAKISGSILAGLLTIGGFAFFGKNIYNVWPIILGVYLFTKTQKKPFKDYLVVAMFGTAMAPIVSQVSFGFGLYLPLGIILGILSGLVAGFILSTLSNHFVKFHRGFNLYNTGFTAGIIATVFMSVFRVFGLENTPQSILSQGNNTVMMIYFILLFTSMLIIGFVLNNYSLKNLNKLMGEDGVNTCDFHKISGFAMSLFNMGVLGIMSVLYVLLVKGDFNGVVIGALLTVSGFGAFGKHFKNTIFVITGVYIVAMVTSLDPGSTEVLIAALFGTCLAPISGRFGWKFGILAGMIHLAIVLNTGYLHGGMNLYNNGFAAGIVAALLVPIIQIFKTDVKHFQLIKFEEDDSQL